MLRKQRKLQPWRRFGYVILIIIKFGELLLWFSPRIINGLRSYIKHSKGCFIWYPNTLKLVQKTWPHLIFLTTSWCLDIGRNTLLRVWYITWLTCFFQTCRGSSICRHLWQHSVFVWEGLQCSKKTSENHWRGSCPRCILWGAAENWWGSCEGSRGSWLCWSRYWCLPCMVRNSLLSTQKFVQVTCLLNQKEQIVIWSRVTDVRSHWDCKIQSKTTGLSLQA